ncbi:30S ribosomal protein S27e [Candidatus Micrarchaeota archaeon]|nr:30S ribosomal protein S27e [Candidatus Micrarchaeota archaeon]
MSKFLSIECKCGQKLIVFGNSKTKVYCPACKAVLVEPKGGKAEISCKILEVLS